MDARRVNVHSSALEHGIDPADGVYAAARHVYVAFLDKESPAREFWLGLTHRGGS